MSKQSSVRILTHKIQNVEWVFQFNDDEPIFFAEPSLFGYSTELSFTIGNTTDSIITFNDNKGNSFKLFAREKQNTQISNNKQSMKQKEWIEKIASGLRKMNVKPDFLLLNDPPYTFESICNIKTITTSLGVTSGYDGDSFDVFPCWNEDGDYMMEVYLFQRGYTEFSTTFGGNNEQQ